MWWNVGEGRIGSQCQCEGRTTGNLRDVMVSQTDERTGHGSGLKVAHTQFPACVRAPAPGFSLGVKRDPEARSQFDVPQRISHGCDFAGSGEFAEDAGAPEVEFAVGSDCSGVVATGNSSDFGQFRHPCEGLAAELAADPELSEVVRPCRQNIATFCSLVVACVPVTRRVWTTPQAACAT